MAIAGVVSRNAGRTTRTYLTLTMSALLFITPVLYLIIGSFKPRDQVLDGFRGFLPENLTLRNYRAVFHSLSSDSTGYYARFFLNSIIISAAIVVVGLVINSMAAYSFTRVAWRGRALILQLVVILIIVPFQVLATPLVYMLEGQRDTLIVQILPFVADAFSIYLFHSFFLSFPKSIEEAGKLDGLGPLGLFLRLVVPNSRPVFASVAILTFLSSWGQFLWPVLVVSDPNKRPLPLELGVFQAQQPVDLGAVFAFGTLLVLPVLVVFLAFQRSFVRSVASSAVKG